MLLASELNQLRSEVAIMARLAEENFDRGVACLHSRDDAAIAEVRRVDEQLDALELSLDQRCMEILLKEPYAVDFRYVFSVAKVVRDIERIGDEAKTVARWSRQLAGPPSAAVLELAGRSRDALVTAVRCLIEGDARLAEQVLEIEFEVDELEDRIIESAPPLAEAFIARALERVGDLATNIAENVIFTVNAADVRHGHFRK